MSSAHNSPIKTRKFVIITALGCVLETYDFLIYALMAPYLSSVFFPAEAQVEGLLLTFATFSAGYLVRPLGGVLFGHHGDRRGRKKPFAWTLLLMASSTALMGCLPGYHEIGIAAPASLLILRLLQGLSMGGESGGAFTYIREILPKQCYVGCGCIVLGMFAGLTLGYLVHAGLLLFMSIETMTGFGWRITFWIGGLLGVIGFVIRTRFQETLSFTQLQRQGGIVTVPLAALFRRHRIEVVCGVLCIALNSTTTILINVFWPTYLETVFTESRQWLSLVGGVVLFLAGLCSVGVGFIADRVGIRKVFVFAVILEFLLVFPIFYFPAQSDQWLAPAFILGAILTGVVSIAGPGMLLQLFPAEVRYTGIGFTYNTGFAIFGGCAPLAATWLIQKTDIAWSPVLLLIVVACIGCLVLYMTRGRDDEKVRLINNDRCIN